MSAIIDFFKAIAGISSTSPLPENLWRLSGGSAIVAVDKSPELSNAGGAVYLQGRGLKEPVLIVKGADGDFLSFSNRCTHAGRKLDPVPGQEALRCCSVNHSRFDYKGNKLSGPAKGPIRTYDCELKDGELVITVSD
jgi:cytochrome b6-f complex iron-sulfur subunit